MVHGCRQSENLYLLKEDERTDSGDGLLEMLMHLKRGMGLIWFLGYIQYQESFPQQMPNSCLQYCFSFSPPLLFCIIDHLAAPPPPPPRRQEAEGRPSGCRSITGAGLLQRRRRPLPQYFARPGGTCWALSPPPPPAAHN